jgi:7-cyano-7-deazaguanine synthase in queuosine biosynthesis
LNQIHAPVSEGVEAMTNNRIATEQRDKEIIIEFSGGIDSLYAAHHLAPQYERIHLLTFNKGYLHFATRANSRNVELLRSLHGAEKFVHRFISVKDIFKRMAVESFRETSAKYGNETAWCIPCRASMGLAAIVYALEHGITRFTDGANWEQAPDGVKILSTADNYPEFLDVIKEFARGYNVFYVPVLYRLNTREERRRELIELGAKIDFNSMERTKKSLFDLFNPRFYKRAQPLCLSGYILHWKRNLFNVQEETSPENVVESIRPKLETIGRAYIESHLGHHPAAPAPGFGTNALSG